MREFSNVWWENTIPRLRDEAQDLIMCVSGKEGRTDLAKSFRLNRV